MCTWVLHVLSKWSRLWSTILLGSKGLTTKMNFWHICVWSMHVYIFFWPVHIDQLYRILESRNFLVFKDILILGCSWTGISGKPTIIFWIITKSKLKKIPYKRMHTKKHLHVSCSSRWVSFQLDTLKHIHLQDINLSIAWLTSPSDLPVA